MSEASVTNRDRMIATLKKFSGVVDNPVDLICREMGLDPDAEWRPAESAPEVQS